MLIDFTDLKNPQVVSYFGVPSNVSYEHMPDDRGHLLYLMTQTTLKIIPLKSSIVLNISIFEKVEDKG